MVFWAPASQSSYASSSLSASAARSRRRAHWSRRYHAMPVIASLSLTCSSTFRGAHSTLHTRNLPVVRIGREGAAFDGVFVKDLFGHGVRWPREPRVVRRDRSCCHAACFDVARDGDDLVWLKTNAHHSASAYIGAAPPTASAPEFYSDPELLVLHSSVRRLTCHVSGRRAK